MLIMKLIIITDKKSHRFRYLKTKVDIVGNLFWTNYSIFEKE